MSSDHVGPRVWIRAVGDYCGAVADERPPLKGLVREALGKSVRRVGRFIQLALIGSGRCVGEAALEPEAGLYLSSARGDLDTTLEVVDALYREGQPAMPLTFINAVSNAGCYYVARELGITGPGNFIGNAGLALESALELAEMDLWAGEIDGALVGSVDISSRHPEKHRTRLGLPEQAAVGEGSHWLWLTVGARRGGAVGELIAARSFHEAAALTDWLAHLDLAADRATITWGQFAAEADAQRVAEALPLGRVQPPPTVSAYYDSQAGQILSAMLAQTTGEPVIYVNRELYGSRIAAVIVRASIH
jgi:hypothetical protein